ncbi:MAG TPA: ABC transporter permease [Streptosporangiaceae bacterium]|nr:ABC transporter permease [Streptosporangiaceae bacterium]
MARFLIRRILLGLFTMWLVTVGVFLIFFVGGGPNSVARRLAGKLATAQDVARIKHQLLLDRSIPVQYGHFLWQLLHGNLGYDYYNQVSVNSLIAAAFPITLSLVIGASILWLVMGVLSGIVSAVKTRSLWDRSLTTLALLFYSMPTFVLGFLLLLALYYELTIHGLSIFPAPGYTYSFTQNPLLWGRELILPWFTLALVSAATYTRLTRGSMLDVSGEDYIRTARSKGMTERRVIFKHTLRSALTPVVTQFGIDVGTLLGGVIITETVFQLPGLGWTSVKAIGNYDLPLIMGVVIIASAGVVAANVLVDVGYAVLDPRVRLH